MSEYVAEITLKRSARGEGDHPVLIAAGSGSAHDISTQLSTDQAMQRALDDAVAVVDAALTKLKELGRAP